MATPIGAAGNLAKQAGQAIGAPLVDAVTAPAQAAASAYGTVTNPHNWLRLAYGLAGLGLVWFGVASMASGTVMSSEAGRAVVGGARKIATKGVA